MHFSASDGHLWEEVIHVDRANQFSFSVVLLEDSPPLHIPAVVVLIINRTRELSKVLIDKIPMKIYLRVIFLG